MEWEAIFKTDFTQLCIKWVLHALWGCTFFWCYYLGPYFFLFWSLCVYKIPFSLFRKDSGIVWLHSRLCLNRLDKVLLWDLENIIPTLLTSLKDFMLLKRNSHLSYIHMPPMGCLLLISTKSSLPGPLPVGEVLINLYIMQINLEVLYCTLINTLLAHQLVINRDGIWHRSCEEKKRVQGTGNQRRNDVYLGGVAMSVVIYMNEFNMCEITAFHMYWTL